MGSVREEEVVAEQRINQKGQRQKTVKAKKMAWFLWMILIIPKAEKNSKRPRLKYKT